MTTITLSPSLYPMQTMDTTYRLTIQKEKLTDVDMIEYKDTLLEPQSDVAMTDSTAHAIEDSSLEIQYATEIVVVPHPQDIPLVEMYAGDLALDFLEPYFEHHRDSIAVGHVFTAERRDGRVVDFCVTSISPAGCAKVRINDDTVGTIDARMIGKREAKELFGPAPSTYALSLQESPPSLMPSVSSPSSSDHVLSSVPARLALNQIQTTPSSTSLSSRPSSSLSSPVSVNGLYKTQSLTEVRDFAPGMEPVPLSPTSSRPGTGLRKYFKGITAARLFTPQAVNPAYSVNLG